MTKINIETPEEIQVDIPEELADELEACEPETEVDPLTQAQNLAKEAEDKYVRLYAEFDNYKKRAAVSQADLRKYANQDFIKSLLPVIDNLEMGMDAATAALKLDEGANDSYLEGFQLTLNEFYKVLERGHVEIIAPVIGDDFDPVNQEAVSQIEMPNLLPNKVAVVFQKGYKLYDRLLRPARVVTSK